MAYPPRRILVTGASGFVGRNLMPMLRRAFPDAVLIAAIRSGNLAVVECADLAMTMDLERLDMLEPVLQQARPDAIIHLAAQAAVGMAFAQPISTWQINLNGTLALAEAVLRHTPKAHMIFPSSAEVYGLSFQDATGPLDEKAPMNPANPYAASKAAADIALGEMALRGLFVTRMRPFNHTGPGQGENFVVAAFAQQAARIEAGLQPPVIKVGALDRWRDLLDVQDVCNAMIRVLQVGPELPHRAVFNIASGQPHRVGDILQGLLDRIGLKVRVEEEASRLRPTDVIRTEGDSRLAQRLLGWAPEVPWDTTLDRVLEDWRRRVRAEAA